jgi:hypothetical protein
MGGLVFFLAHDTGKCGAFVNRVVNLQSHEMCRIPGLA